MRDLSRRAGEGGREGGRAGGKEGRREGGRYRGCYGFVDGWPLPGGGG